ncbi:MAG: DUF3667 domain-containing protein [Gammaproteobacteria bacterium]|nr:DUF3667 domain-containing protein [Gammaproteobacteria bacterium]
MTDTHASEPDVFCANCGTQKDTEYCPHCGQNNRDYDKSVVSIIKTVVGELFELDARTTQTAKELFMHPGRLSVEFRKNRRASYSTPIRVYLVTSLIYFFVVSILLSAEDRIEANRLEEARNDPVAELDVSVEDFQVRVDKSVEKLQGKLARDSSRKLREVLSREGFAPAKTTIESVLYSISEQEEYSDSELFFLEAGINTAHAPDQAFDAFIGNLPFCMLILVPWIALMLKWTYAGLKIHYAHHIVFTMHTFSFIFIILTISALLVRGLATFELPGQIFLSTGTTIYVILYVVFAIRENYKQGWLLTTGKFLALLALSSLMLIPSVALVAVITFMQL